MELTESKITWQNRADNCIAQGALTNSKRPMCFVRGVYPTHATKGRGCYLVADNGKQYVDFICGLGANLLGYGQQEVAFAVGARALEGAAMSLSSTLEVEVAESIKALFPFIDHVKFLKTGTDTTTAAIRIARAKTDRATVLSEGYHGWSDGFVSMTPPATGVKDSFDFQKLSADLSNIDDSIAAVIVEPVVTDWSKERIQWLKELREKCTKYGTMLIFDEVITGFRFPKYSVSGMTGISPDLICLGKAMGNGMPIGVVGGKRDVMNCGEYFVSSTFAGETCSLAAAQKVIQLLSSKYSIDTLWEQGGLFLKRFNSLYPEKLRIDGYPTRGAFAGDPLTKALFFQEACKAGILFGPSWFFNFCHIELMDSVLNTCNDILTRIKTGSVVLEGEMPSTPFAQKVRENGKS